MKIHILQTIKKFRALLGYSKSTSLIILGAVFFAAQLTPFVPVARVLAQGEEFALYVGTTPAQKKAVADTWDNKHDSYDDGGWNGLKILARGGMFGKEGKVLMFNADDTKGIACKKAGISNILLGPIVNTPGCESREPIFTIEYYCTLDKPGAILFNRPPDNKNYFRVQYGIALHDNGNNGDEFVARNTFNGYSGILRVNQNSVTDSGYGREDLRYDITDGDKRPQQLDDGDKGNKDNNDKFGIPDKYKACRPSGAAVSQLNNIKNYAKLSNAERAKFPRITAALAGNGAGAGGGGSGGDDCDVKATSPLSWIICPVIDLGQNMTDFVFKKFIEPFMENVPVSTDPRDSTYKAWQQFRIIANVLLIGTMLAVVYAQLKGDR